ncbi:zinc transporter ZIP10-like isoform X2 [Hyla sarda]|uniref:zinc transporter ZIP10-like isoform X2 n=1 Tax=Hyla sarda TaxID=327740 RepID=UPI0024C2C391|nr:zinc transporter ZIP10-like isoform X2 [Hyla sarda]
MMRNGAGCGIEMKVHMHTKFCFICLFTFIFHHCNHCHGYAHDHTPEESHTHRHNDYQISQEPYFPTSKSSPPDAELEQRYYIEKLFHHYGDNGRLSYSGLEKLLSSLGLGEVKVVEIGHEDVGHDHDSHSDTLHVRDPVDSNHHTEEKNDSKTVSECKEKKASVSPEHKSTHKNHSHHPHHHHHHVHNGTHHNHSHHNHTVNHVSLEGQTNDPLPGTNATQEQVVEKKMHKHKKRRKGTKTSEAALNSQSDLEQTQDENKHGYKHDHNSASSLNPVNVDHDNHEWEEPRQGVEALQRNTRKREAPNDHTSMKTHVGLERSHGQHVHEVHEHNECLNVTQLLSYFGLNMNSPISPEQFTYICPALLYQIDRRFCIKHFTGLQMETVEESKAGASAWVCGLISITVISLLSLLGVILIPFINQGCFKFLLNFFVALAVGTLSGDALLHLLPHSQGGHDHSSDEHGHSHDHGKDLDEASSKEFLVEYDSVMKGLVALGGIYLLFIVEHCLRMFKHYKERRGRPSRLKRKAEEAAVGRKLSDHKLNRRSDAEWLQLKPLAEIWISKADTSLFIVSFHLAPEDPASSESQQLNETEMTYVDSLNQSPMKVFVASEDTMPHINKDGSCDDDHSADDGHFDNNHAKVEMPKKHSHSKHSHHSHGHCHSGKDLKDTGIASIAWMVIMGDGMHNFSDGLAIGAAFSTGFTGGISTSVAVFCHELPHELGDFAVLLKAGMTVNQAIVYNLLSAMMAYIGMLIGTAVGQYADNITLWIFAITAGMFLYVALVDMLPEMLHGDGENEDGYCNFILQNLGLLLGFAIMLVIALYEDKIVFDIQL